MSKKDKSTENSQLFQEGIIDYIISLTHLYGLVHKDKAAEIFSLQNEKKVDAMVLNAIMEDPPQDLTYNGVKIYGDYFVHEAIMESDELDRQLERGRDKSFYIPPREELLRYKDDFYFEVTKQYRALLGYVTEHIFKGDELAAEMLCEDIQGICQFDFSLQEILEVFNTRGVVFESEKQVDDVLKLIMDLANNNRVWENNGHTPAELSMGREGDYLQPLAAEPFKFDKADLIDFKIGKKVGRNDPCPCGSGKKYKKCCLAE